MNDYSEHGYAGLVELVDTPGLSPGARNGVGLRVPYPAPSDIQPVWILLSQTY